MSIELYRRPANVTIKQARTELIKHLPKTARIVSIDLDPKSNEIVAKVDTAKRKVAEFPPSKEAPMDAPVEDGLEAADDVDLDLSDDLGEDEPVDKMDEVLDLLRSIADTVGANGPEEGLDDLGEVGPEIGSPEPGVPLPPPAEEPKGPTFASLNPKVASQRSFTVERTDCAKISTADIKAEVEAGFPGTKVARLVRSADKNTARIALVRV